jgi:uncharacterized protein
MPAEFDAVIRTVEELREVVAPPNEGVAMKLGEGKGDASPKGDDPGFVVVEDDHTLIIPDRPGNNLAFGLTNIIATGQVGLLFIIPGTTETLRVNGRAELSRDPELLEDLAARGKPAVLAIRVHVEEVFFHCAKAFIRSQLWKHETWPPKQKISFGAMFAAKLDAADDQGLVTMIDEAIDENYRTAL